MKIFNKWFGNLPKLSLSKTIPEKGNNKQNTKGIYDIKIDLIKNDYKDVDTKKKYEDAIEIIKSNEKFCDAFTAIISDQMVILINDIINSENKEETLIKKYKFDELNLLLSTIEFYKTEKIDNTTEETTRDDV